MEKDPIIESKNPDTSIIHNNNKYWARKLFDRKVGFMNFVLDACL
jgi:hypothetical protein